MFQNLALNKFYGYGVGIALSFAFLIYAFNLAALIIVLNGVLTGCGVAVAVAFWRLFWRAIRGVEPYSDTKQMALSIALMWIVIGLSVASSFQLRLGLTEDIPAPLVTTVLSRFLAIVAAVVQVATLDFGQGVFYGPDRKLMWLAGSIGFVVALAAILAQTYQVLS